MCDALERPKIRLSVMLLYSSGTGLFYAFGNRTLPLYLKACTSGAAVMEASNGSLGPGLVSGFLSGHPLRPAKGAGTGAVGLFRRRLEREALRLASVASTAAAPAGPFTLPVTC